MCSLVQAVHVSYKGIWKTVELYNNSIRYKGILAITANLAINAAYFPSLSMLIFIWYNFILI